MSRARDLADRGNQNTLAVDTVSSEVGIASTVPSSTLDVRGEVKIGTTIQAGVAGVLTATSFSGSGANLTGLATTETVRTDTLTVAGVSTLTGAVNVDATTDSTSVTTGALIVDGGVGIAKNVYIGAGLSVAGTLTYEDVTNVDAVGLITAKSGINITGGDYTQTGGGEFKVGAALTIGSAGVATFIAPAGVGVTITPSTGKVEATTYYGDGSNLSNITSTTINNNADNRLISGSGTANTLNGESTLTYDGSTLALTGNQTISSKLTVGSGITFGSAGVATFSGTADVHLLDNVKLNVGDGSDLQVYHDGSNSFISDEGTGILRIRGSEVRLSNPSNSTYFTGTSGGSAKIYYNDALKLETTNDGTVTTGIATATGGVTINADNAELRIGASNDVIVWHDGTDSNIKSNTNQLKIRGADIRIKSADDGETMAAFYDDGACELNFNNSKKFETTNDGVVISGICTDSLGNVRGIPQNPKGTNYTLVKSDAGKHIYCTSTPTITVNNSVFATGDVITVVNASTSDMTITQGSGQNLYIPGESSAGSLTLGTYGIMTMLCTASDGSVMWCSGAELTKS